MSNENLISCCVIRINLFYLHFLERFSIVSVLSSSQKRVPSWAGHHYSNLISQVRNVVEQVHFLKRRHWLQRQDYCRESRLVHGCSAPSSWPSLVSRSKSQFEGGPPLLVPRVPL
jgi:hypothetical protein